LASVAAPTCQPGRSRATREAKSDSTASAGSGAEGWPWLTMMAEGEIDALN